MDVEVGGGGLGGGGGVPCPRGEHQQAIGGLPKRGHDGRLGGEAGRVDVAGCVAKGSARPGMVNDGVQWGAKGRDGRMGRRKEVMEAISSIRVGGHKHGRMSADWRLALAGITAGGGWRRSGHSRIPNCHQVTSARTPVVQVRVVTARVGFLADAGCLGLMHRKGPHKRHPSRVDYLPTYVCKYL